MDVKDVVMVVLVVVDAVSFVGLICFWSASSMWKDLAESARRDRDRVQNKLDEVRVTISKQNRLIRIMALNDGIESPIFPIGESQDDRPCAGEDSVD